MGKPTVLRDGPGTINDRKARLHRALDAALDARAARDEARMPYKSCEIRTMPSGRAYVKLPDGKEQTGFPSEAAAIKWVNQYEKGSAKDEYKYAEKPKQAKPIVTFLDRYVAKKAEEAKTSAARGKDAVNPVGSTRHDVQKAPANVAPMAKVIPRSKRPAEDAASFEAQIKAVSEGALGKVKTAATMKDTLAKYEVIARKALSEGVPLAKVTAVLKAEKSRLTTAKASDSEKDAWKRDTDAGSAKLVKRELEQGMTPANIVKKYGFSASFVDDLVSKKLKKTHKDSGYAKDVAPV